MGTFELRPVCADDLSEIIEMIQRSERHDRIPHAVVQTELEEFLDQPYIDLDRDTRAAVVHGQIVGWSWLWNPPSEVRLERAFCFGEVDPDHRGQGIGRELLGWSRDRAVERLRARDHDLPCFVRVQCYDWQHANRRLFSRLGFDEVRYGDELIRPLTDLPHRDVPPGVQILPWPGPEHWDELRVLRNAAFEDHWGSAPLDESTWTQLVGGYGTRLDLSMIAVDEGSGAVVGLALNMAYPDDEEVTGRREALIDNLATARDWRGRGIASALIAASFERFAASGEFTHAAIEVDTDNPTGAARLYRNLGFEPLVRSVTHQIEVTDR